MRKTAIVAGILAAVLVLFAALRAPVLEGRSLGWLRPYYTLFFPPNDLYEPLVRLPIDARNSGGLHFAFTARYVGGYTAGFYLKGEFQYYPKAKWQSRFLLTCQTKSGAGWEAELGGTMSPFVGLRGDGYDLAWFQVPAVLPQGERIECDIRALSGWQELIARYEEVEFYVAKHSDL